MPAEPSEASKGSERRRAKCGSTNRYLEVGLILIRAQVGSHFRARSLGALRHVYTVLSDTTFVVLFALSSYHSYHSFPLTMGLQFADIFKQVSNG
jgi:hypothetical protein